MGAATLSEYAENSRDRYAEIQLTGLTISDVKAKEFQYHRSCYRHLSRPETNKDQYEEKIAREKCFEDLKGFVEKKIIKEGEFVRLNTLADYYGKLQDELNIKRKGDLVRNLKSRMINAFGEKISFFQKSEGLPEFMYGTEDVPFKGKLGEDDPMENVRKVGKLIRAELLKAPDMYSSWPPDEQQLLTKEFDTPALTEALLLSILSAREKKTERISRLIDSEAQDLTYNASMGRTRVKKHVQLGISIKRKTASVEVIRLLNHYGHSISYDEVNVLETRLAEDQVQHQNLGNYIPNNIQPSTFVTFIYDNCDHNVESIYNKGPGNTSEKLQPESQVLVHRFLFVYPP